MTKNFGEIESPYRPFEVASDDWFFHEDVVNQIKEIFGSSEGNRVIVLQGNPGSGKSSTLKRIGKSPEILGKNYISVYLDLKEYINLKPDELLPSLYNDLVEKVNKFGYKIPQLTSKKETNIAGNILEMSLLLIDSALSGDTTLVLIFDESDNLLEHIDDKAIAGIIESFKKIERSWQNYGLILSGNKKLYNLSSSNTINGFLKKATLISIEQVLEEESIKKLIVDPVKEQLTYDDDAIKRIIWLSGKNLYFQQLICHYIFNELTEKNKNHCSLSDVEEAIKRIWKDERPEFSYAWENILSLESRLITSALVDRSVTEKRGKFYFLKEKSLLDDILGDDFFEEINKLEDFGLINKAAKRRFEGYPFKIPLYGEWVKEKQPFVKTVIEHVEAISDKIDLTTLIDWIKRTSNKKLSPFNAKNILGITQKWCILKKSIMQKESVDDKKQVENFFLNLSKLLNLNIKEHSTSSFIIDIRGLGIEILDEAFCFIQDRPKLTAEYIEKIENKATAVAQDTQTKLTLFFYFQRSEMVEDLVKKPHLNLIAIDENDLKKIMLSDSPEEVFKKFILSKLSLHKVSPYRTEGPAKATFYGRTKIINRIIGATDTSYAIVGARRIGKSSLLHQIRDRLPHSTYCILMDLELEFSDVKNYKTFLKSLEKEMSQVFKKRIDFGWLSAGRNLSKLSTVVHQLSKEVKKIIFILDEVDELIAFDKQNNFKLMKTFRKMSQKNYCQFIFSGFKELYHHKRDIETPAYNFYKEIRLKPLDPKPALELITKPMRNIGVQYKNERDRHLILEYTSCHPNLLQFFCEHLIDKIEEHETEDSRTIFREDIDELYDSTYEEYVIDDVYMFFSDLNDINKLIIMLLAANYPNKKSFSTDEIKDKLTKNGIEISINDVHANLRNLVMRFILLDEGRDSYCFALPVFPDIIKKRIDVTFKNRLIKEIKKNES